MTGIVLQRTKFFTGHTRGILSLNGAKICETLELPWKDNEKDISCIPEGEYVVNGRDFGKYQAIYQAKLDHKVSMWVTKVDGRSNILIHTGNTAKDTLGCILVGEKYDFGAPFIANSMKAYQKLYEAIKIHIEPQSGIWMEIKNPDKIPETKDVFSGEAEFTPEDRANLDEKEL